MTTPVLTEHGKQVRAHNKGVMQGMAKRYLALRKAVTAMGYGEEIEWAENITPPEDAAAFAQEVIWVIMCAGMKEQVVRDIHFRVMSQLGAGRPVLDVFGHKGKVRAIEKVWCSREELFAQYQWAEEKPWEQDPLDFFESLPWIGPITKYHLGRNLGMQVCKPDRHMTRIAEGYGVSVQSLGTIVGDITGHKPGVVDMVFWRAANLGLI